MKKTILTMVLLFSALGFSTPTLEERIKVLESKVAKLEALTFKKSANTYYECSCDLTDYDMYSLSIVSTAYRSLPRKTSAGAFYTVEECKKNLAQHSACKK